MRLAIILTTAPERGDLHRAVRLARVARARGDDVGVFVMDDAVPSLCDDPASLTALLDDDCDVVVCALSAHLRGIKEEHLGVMLGSQDDHAALVSRADRVVSFS